MFILLFLFLTELDFVHGAGGTISTADEGAGGVVVGVGVGRGASALKPSFLITIGRDEP